MIKMTLRSIPNTCKNIIPPFNSVSHNKILVYWIFKLAANTGVPYLVMCTHSTRSLGPPAYWGLGLHFGHPWCLSLTPSQPDDVWNHRYGIHWRIMAGLSGPLQCLMGGNYGGINIKGVLPQRRGEGRWCTFVMTRLPTDKHVRQRLKPLQSAL